MKRILFGAIGLLFAFTSCKKKSDVIPVNTISATIDGVGMNFNTNVNARFTGNFEGTGNIGLVILGATTNSGPTSNMGISFVTANSGTIIKGTYSAASANNNPPVWAALAYTDYNPGSGQPATNYITNVNTALPFTITITSISSTNIQGTFSGSVTDLNNISNSKTVTNGKFNVNITN